MSIPNEALQKVWPLLEQISFRPPSVNIILLGLSPTDTRHVAGARDRKPGAGSPAADWPGQDSNDIETTRATSCQAHTQRNGQSAPRRCRLRGCRQNVSASPTEAQPSASSFHRNPASP